MGTRSLTVIVDSPDYASVENEIAVIYRQFDGYPTGHGQELADLINVRKMVNGISGNAAKVANGFSCLAALLVRGLKTDDAGGTYLHRAGTRDCGEDYVYYVYGGGENQPVMLRVESCGTARKVIYQGECSKFNAKKAEKLAS